MSPGGSLCAARQFLEKSRNAKKSENGKVIHFKHDT